MPHSYEEIIQRILGFENNFSRFIIDPLYGQIGLTELEDKVINTTSFRRLKKIQQLGFISDIYPGASHKRYEHCIGTLHISWTMFKRFIKNYVLQRKWSNLDILKFFSDDIITSMRLASLLHDLGHGPFSHALEGIADYLGIPINHEQITSYLLTYKTPRDSIKEIIHKPEILDAMIKDKKINECRKELSIIPREIREIILGIYNKTYKSKIAMPEGFHHIRLFLHDILKGDIGADRIDYLLRDTYFSGLGHRFNFSDLLENLRGMYDNVSEKLLLAVDSKGKNIVEFLLMTRYYHYRLIAHHPLNMREQIKFRMRIEQYLDSQRKISRNSETLRRLKHLLQISMEDDSIETKLPLFKDDVKFVGFWDLGSIGMDWYRFLFYRIIRDISLRLEYAQKIKENIVNGVKSIINPSSTLEEEEIYLSFVVEKPHIPIIQLFLLEYMIEKDVLEKYSVLLHDHSILIRGLARTYLSDTSLLVFTTDEHSEDVLKFTQFTRHFYLNPKIFANCLQNIDITNLNKYDFLLLSLYQITEGGKKQLEGISRLFKEIERIHDKLGLHIYDFKTQECWDPNLGPFCYPKVSHGQDSLIDDLFLFDVAGLIEINTHLTNKKYGGKTFHAASYLIKPTKREKEVGLKGEVIPIEYTLGFYPETFIKKYKC